MRLLTAALLAALAVAAGCYRPTLAPCSVKCGAGGSCPTGMTCGPNQFCHPAGTAPAVCGCAADPSILGVVDDFDGGPDPSVWASPYPPDVAVAVKQDGRLKIKLAGTPGYAGWSSQDRFDVTGRRVLIEVPRVPNPAAASVEAYFLVVGPQPSPPSSGFTLQNGNLNFFSPASTKLETHDLSRHRWWQIREARGTLYFEYSADGTTWVVGDSAPAPAWIGAAEVEIGGGTYGVTTDPGEMHFDNLDLPPCR